MTNIFEDFLQQNDTQIQEKSLQDLASTAWPSDIDQSDLPHFGPLPSHYSIGKNLTEALKTHGFDTQSGNLTEKAQKLLTDPILRPYLLAHSGNQIVLRISELMEEKKAAIKKATKKIAIKEAAQEKERSHSPSNTTADKKKTLSFTFPDETFKSFWALSISLAGEDEASQRLALQHFIELYSEADSAKAIDFCDKHLDPEVRWAFLSVVAKKYEGCRTGNLSVSFRDALTNQYDATLNQMTAWTRWQSWGMWGAGFCFGIEVVLIVLEKIALQDFDDALSTEEMAGILLASCMLSCSVLGSFTGDFFVGAHYNELLKQNCESYFNKHFQKINKSQEAEPGETRARWGTILEGLLVLRGLLGAAAFVIFDLSILAAKGGNYASNIPGVYSFEQLQNTIDNEIGFGLLVGTLASFMLVSIGWSAYSLAAGHYALDGKGMIEYCQEKEKYENQSVSIETGSQILCFRPTLSEKVTGFSRISHEKGL